MTTLSQAKAGQTYTIKWMIVNREAGDLLEKLELKVDQQIKLIQEFHGSVLIHSMGHTYAISEDVARRIRVVS